MQLFCLGLQPNFYAVESVMRWAQIVHRRRLGTGFPPVRAELDLFRLKGDSPVTLWTAMLAA